MDESPSKHERAGVFIKLLPFLVYGEFFRRSRAAYFADPGPTLPNFKPIKAFIAVLVTCNNEEDPKMEKARVFTRFPHYILLELSVAMETRVLT